MADQPVRRRMAPRRIQFTEKLEVAGQRYLVSVGIRLESGEPAEVFIAGPKDGSTLAQIVGDAGLVLSLALQSGITIDSIAESVGRLPEGGPSSVIGAAVDMVQRMKRELQPDAPPE